MAYDATKPITTSNCPTRTALERKPGDKGFRAESINARHSERKRMNHVKNVQERASGPKKQKVSK